jgi:hypothetical protein
VRLRKIGIRERLPGFATVGDRDCVRMPRFRPEGRVNQFPFRPDLRSGSQLGCPRSPGRGCPMCDKCVEHDKKIEHFEKMLLAIGDSLTVDRLKAMIRDLQAQKATLHPDPK